LTTPIALFLAFGACFGLLTYSRRHLFSGGPSRRDDAGAGNGLAGRLMWVAICTLLWPIMALTGLYSLWRLARARTGRNKRP
jgi:hypothetical protein